MENFFVKIFLQRRRLLVGALLFFVYGLIDYGVIEGDGFAATVALSMAFVAVCTIIAAFAITIFPSYRQTYEVIGVGLILLVCGEIVKPGWFADEVVFQTVWGMVGLCLGSTVLHHVIYGDWWGKLNLTLLQVSKGRLLIEATAEDVWARAVPDAAAPDQYYSGTLESFAEVDHPMATNRMRVKIGNGAVQESFAEVTMKRPFEVYEMLTWWVDDEVNQADDRRSVMQIKFAERAGGTDISVVEINREVDVANWLFLWFDNPIEQALYSLRSKVENRSDPTYFGYLRQQVIENG